MTVVLAGMTGMCAQVLWYDTVTVRQSFTSYTDLIMTLNFQSWLSIMVWETECVRYQLSRLSECCSWFSQVLIMPEALEFIPILVDVALVLSVSSEYDMAVVLVGTRADIGVHGCWSWHRCASCIIQMLFDLVRVVTSCGAVSIFSTDCYF
jgi:hypothetical protein